VKIALIYDHKKRKDTTGGICQRALRQKHEVVHLEPEELSKIEEQKFDLFMNIDDGLHYGFPARLKPSLFWAIDTHLQPEWYLEKAKNFSHVFCAQKQGAELLRNSGIPARWCPLACDPEIHRPHPLPKILDISFVGNMGGRFRYKNYFWTGKEFFKERGRLIYLLKKKFNLFMGNFYFEDMAIVYSISKMVFNRSVKDDVNMRVFEALGCGSLLVTNRIHPVQDLLFKNREHLVEYTTDKELMDTVGYYLHHPEERENIAEKGRAIALKKHTYAHRMDYMLSFLTPHTEKRFNLPGGRGQGGEDDWFLSQAALTPFFRDLKKGIEVGDGPKKLLASAIGIDVRRQSAQTDLISSGGQWPFRDGELDYVIASNSLGYFPNIQNTLREWRRILKIGGILGITLPDDRIIDTSTLNPQQRQAWTMELLKEYLGQVGGFEFVVLQEIVDAWNFGCICRKI
jgi:hypothetical protein